MDGSVSFGLLVDGDTAELVFADDNDYEPVALIHRSQGPQLAEQLEFITPQRD